MFHAKTIDVNDIRRFYALDASGHLVDHEGKPATRLIIGKHAYIVTALNARIAYRRAVWACAHDVVPDRIYKIDRDGEECLPNLSDKPVASMRYTARVMVNNRMISLGRYGSRATAQRVEEEYKLNGPRISVRHDLDGYSVYEFRGQRPKKVHGPFETLAVAHGVSDCYAKFGNKVPVVVTDGVKALNIGYAYNAYTAWLRAKDWIAANPDSPFNQPYAYF